MTYDHLILKADDCCTRLVYKPLAT